MVDKKTLINFSEEIASYYEQGKIKSPIHLDGSIDGSLEDFLIDLFKDYKQGDWIFSTHRSHYCWLLSGRGPEELKKQILDGHSMHIFDDRFFTSAIVSGCAPIALGVAEALKLKKSSNKVWCVLGDMAASGGLVKECIQYSEGWDLPIIYVVLDNCMSVRACTTDTWGTENIKNKVIKYRYKRVYQHAGCSKEGEAKKYVMF